MSNLYFVTHPDVDIDPSIPIPEWHLSDVGKERMKSLLKQPWMKTIEKLFSSRENKAVDGAMIVTSFLNIEFEQIEGLGEIDRSSTGYLADDFWEVVKDFFGHPNKSVRGWERATDAQARIVKAVDEIVRQYPNKNILIISHGAVGALLLAHIINEPISILYEQPATGGGNYFVIDMKEISLLSTWKRIDE